MRVSHHGHDHYLILYLLAMVILPSAVLGAIIFFLSEHSGSVLCLRVASRGHGGTSRERSDIKYVPKVQTVPPVSFVLALVPLD